MEEFMVDNLPCRVCLQQGKINFNFGDCKQKQTKQNAIDILDVLSIVSPQDKEDTLHLNFVVRTDAKKMRVHTFQMEAEPDTCAQFKGKVDSILKDLVRPRNLLVFINPESGHKKGVKIYSSKVAPLFKLCNINAQVIVTERPGQPRELLSSYNLRLLHGIVSVGGDGMYSECVNGLLERLQQDAEVDVDDPEAPIVASKIPIGIVPAGSGNYLLNYIHGTTDVETAVIKILLGDHLMTNVVGVHQGRGLSYYSSLVTEFGLIGDMMHDCEKFRWMGPARYNIIPVTTLLKRRTVDVQVEYLPAEVPKQRPCARSRFQRQISLPAIRRCQGDLQRLNSSPCDDINRSEGWKKLDGRVFGVDTYVVTQKERKGELTPCFGDSALTMWVTDKCSLSQHTQQLTKLQQHKAGCWDYDFIRRERVCGYRVKLTSAPSTMDETGERHLQKKFYINVDGQALRLTSPEFEVRLHQNAMPIFGKTMVK